MLEAAALEAARLELRFCLEVGHFFMNKKATKTPSPSRRSQAQSEPQRRAQSRRPKSSRGRSAGPSRRRFNWALWAQAPLGCLTGGQLLAAAHLALNPIDLSGLTRISGRQPEARGAAWRAEPGRARWHVAPSRRRSGGGQGGQGD